LLKWLAAVVLEALLREARSISTQKHVRVLASFLAPLRVARAALMLSTSFVPYVQYGTCHTAGRTFI
jgi:hypothetical protein